MANNKEQAGNSSIATLDEVRQEIEFIPVSHVDEVWDTILPDVFE